MDPYDPVIEPTPYGTSPNLFYLVKHLDEIKPTILQNEQVKTRASVAIIIRILPPHQEEEIVREEKQYELLGSDEEMLEDMNIDDFLSTDWVKQGKAQILFIQRAHNPSDRWRGNIALPGGKLNPGESALEAARREVFEEIGIDLLFPKFQYIGRLDDREVQSPLGNKTWMILSTFVYLQVTPHTPQMQLLEEEVAHCFWVDVEYLIQRSGSAQSMDWIEIDLIDGVLPSSYPNNPPLTPDSESKESWWRTLGHWFLGKVYSRAISLPKELTGIQQLPKSYRMRVHRADEFLWGITFGIVAECLDLMYPITHVPYAAYFAGINKHSHVDINFFMGLTEKMFRSGKRLRVEGEGKTPGQFDILETFKTIENSRVKYEVTFWNRQRRFLLSMILASLTRGVIFLYVGKKLIRLLYK